MTNFVEELRWRGLLHDIMPETEAHLLEHATILDLTLLQTRCILEVWYKF